MNTLIVLSQYFKDRTNIRNMNLHLDNDTIGRIATKALVAALFNDYTVINESPQNGKDYNDQLCDLLGLSLKNQVENYIR